MYHLAFVCSYHWPNGILYYTIDAAFSESERAVIASGITHMEENSCIRFQRILNAMPSKPLF